MISTVRLIPEDLDAIRVLIAKRRAGFFDLEPKHLTLRSDRLVDPEHSRPARVFGYPVVWVEAGPDDIDIA